MTTKNILTQSPLPPMVIINGIIYLFSFSSKFVVVFFFY